MLYVKERSPPLDLNTGRVRLAAEKNDQDIPARFLHLLRNQTSMTVRSADDQSLSAWAPLRQPIFRMLWIASVVSNIGTWMHEVGAGWLMTTLAPSPLMVALVQAATSAPVFLLALPAGALADIVDRRRYLIASQIWMMTAATLLGVLTLAGVTTAITLLVFTFALGIGTAMMMPAWGAITPELVPRSELHAAIGLNSIGMNVSRSVGPAIAGFVVAAAGPGVVFILNALSFLAVIVALKNWKSTPMDNTLPAERVLGAMRAGLRYARHSPELRAVLTRGAGFFVFASASWALLPLVVRQELQRGPGTYGLFLACLGVGAILGCTQSRCWRLPIASACMKQASRCCSPAWPGSAWYRP
jgi:MFS family permease